MCATWAGEWASWFLGLPGVSQIGPLWPLPWWLSTCLNCFNNLPKSIPAAQGWHQHCEGWRQLDITFKAAPTLRCWLHACAAMRGSASLNVCTDVFLASSSFLPSCLQACPLPVIVHNTARAMALKYESDYAASLLKILKGLLTTSKMKPHFLVRLLVNSLRFWCIGWFIQSFPYRAKPCARGWD